MSRIVFGCCVGDWARFEAYVRPRVTGLGEVIALGGQTRIASAYNKILRACAASFGPGDALVLLHDDLEIVDSDAVAKIRETVREHTVTGVIGCAGEFDGALWWEGEGQFGRQQTDNMLIQRSPFRGPATAVDGSLLILNYRAVRSLRFDEGFDAFHGYEVDLCRQAAKLDQGMPWADNAVWVTDIETHHHTIAGVWKDRPAWERAHARMREKWQREETRV